MAPSGGRRKGRGGTAFDALIIGLGNDLVDIRRIEDGIARFGDRFLGRIFTAHERAFCDGCARPAWRYAKRFAAKEACSKALGTGMREGVAWRDMGVVNAKIGYPTLHLTGGALARLNAMTPSGHRVEVRLSMSDEYPFAEAVVVVSAEPEARRW
jgi:holo-[acyl-carrier protein] synthase